MKKYGLTIWLILLGIFTAFLTICAATAGAAPEVFENPCDYFSSGSEYLNPDLPTERVMEIYHSTMNMKFNDYIQKMIKADPNEPGKGKAPENPEECLAGDNYSTFCVAYNLLMNDKFGYMKYRKALDCRKYTLFDGAVQRDQWNKYIDTMIYGETAEENVQAIYQGQKVLEISAKLDGIEREIVDAKAALDQTLAAYEELKTAWPMHKKYIEIYEDLIKYRDKLAEIRSFIEEFPSKFIDATTTQCT
jgi:hypothetical protein